MASIVLRCSTSEWTALHSKSPVLNRAFLIPLRPSSFSAKSPACFGCLPASVLATPPRRCQPFAGNQAHPFQSKLTALPTRLFPLPRTCARIPAGLNGPSFPNKKAHGRVPFLYDPGAAGECIFMREDFSAGSLKLCCGQEGSRSAQRLERAAGKKAACSADSVVAIRRGKFHQKFRPVSSSGWR